MHAIGAKSMADIGDLYRDYDVIAVDEGQFFPDVCKLTFQLYIPFLFFYNIYIICSLI